MAPHPLLGTWELERYHVRFADGREIEPLGADPLGWIVYTPDGLVAGMMMRRDRPAFAGPDRLAGSLQEKAAAFDSCITYFGFYRIEGERVVHRIRASLFPNWSGEDQAREIHFLPDGRVELTGHFAENGVRRSAIVRWRRRG